MSFKEFLRLDEAKKAILPNLAAGLRPPPEAFRTSDLASKDVDTRLASGLAGEEKVVKALKYYVGPTEVSTVMEDRKPKIDAHVDLGGGNVVTVQIKKRDEGRDLLYEYYKNYTGRGTEPNGRDYRGKSKGYAVLSPDQRMVHLADADKLRQIAKGLVKEWEDAGGLSSYRGSQGIVRYQYSHDYDGQSKVIVYVPPEMLRGSLTGFPAGPLVITAEVLAGKPGPGARQPKLVMPQTVSQPKVPGVYTGTGNTSPGSPPAASPPTSSTVSSRP